MIGKDIVSIRNENLIGKLELLYEPLHDKDDYRDAWTSIFTCKEEFGQIENVYFTKFIMGRKFVKNDEFRPCTLKINYCELDEVIFYNGFECKGTIIENPKLIFDIKLFTDDYYLKETTLSFKFEEFSYLSKNSGFRYIARIINIINLYLRQDNDILELDEKKFTKENIFIDYIKKTCEYINSLSFLFYQEEHGSRHDKTSYDYIRISNLPANEYFCQILKYSLEMINGLYSVKKENNTYVISITYDKSENIIKDSLKFIMGRELDKWKFLFGQLKKVSV